MLRQAFFILIVCSATSFVNAKVEMYCSDTQANNPLSNYANTCTELIYGDKTYCCRNPETGANFCCDAMQYAQNQFGNILAAVIGVVAVVMVLICCISCLCCTCCPWYRRRHRGTVYGKVQGPRSVVQVIQTPGHVVQAPPAQPRHTAYAYPANQTVMPYPPAQAPPQYTTEMYGKQAPYNPNYAQ